MTKFFNLPKIAIVFIIIVSNHSNGLAQSFNSENFKLESVSFSTENALYSTTDSIPPTISSAGPKVTETAETTATVTWTTDKPGNSLVFFGQTTDYGSQQGNFTESVTNHTVKIVGLQPNQTYHYKVRTRDVAGNNGDSADATFSTKTTDITPPKITGEPKIAVVKAREVTIEWTTDESSTSKVRYSTDQSFDKETGTDQAVAKHSVTITGLEPKTSYHYKTVSKDSSGNETVSSAGQFTTTSVPAILGVLITDLTLSSAVISWATSVATTTVINYGPTTDYGQKHADDNLTTSHTVRLTSLTSGVRYYLQVSGLDVNHNQLLSDVYLIDVLPIPAITKLEAKPLSPNQVRITLIANTPVDYLIEYQAAGSSLRELTDKDKKPRSTGEKNLKTDHTVEFNGLLGSTTYDYSVTIKDLFGNQAVSGPQKFTTLSDFDRPIITEVKTDPSLEVSGNDRVQILVTWKTDEPSTSQVEYGEGPTGDYAKKTTELADLVTDHVVVIPNLNPNTTYHLRVTGRDLAGNYGVSTDYLVLTPAKARSISQLILERLENQLGWLVRIFQ